jgi:putative SOS response-associated peptidase YedK
LGFTSLFSLKSSNPAPPPTVVQVCPKSKSVIIRRNGKSGQYELDRLVWGLVPSFVVFSPVPPLVPFSPFHPSLTYALRLRSWFKEPPAAGLSTINAQCESVFEPKASWRGPRDNKRCVVLAQGFYEWLQKGKDKVPYFVKRKDGKLMAFGASFPSVPLSSVRFPFV